MQRLTDLLDTLRGNPSAWSEEQTEALVELCRNLGRYKIAGQVESVANAEGNADERTSDEQGKVDTKSDPGDGDNNDLYDLI